MEAKVEYLQRLWLAGYNSVEAARLMYIVFATALSGSVVSDTFNRWEHAAANITGYAYHDVLELLKRVKERT